jgi:hypothetical protein
LVIDMDSASGKRTAIILGSAVLVILAACAIAYLKLRPDRGQAEEAGDDVGDMRYTLVCDACSASFELSATELAQQFSEAQNRGAAFKCARCGALRAHLKTVAESKPQVEIPPDIADSPEKLEALVRETHARIAEIDGQLTDPGLKSDAARRQQLQQEYEQLHYKADALARRWAELVGPEGAPAPASRPGRNR